MLKISETGLVIHEKVKLKIISRIEIAKMGHVNGIIVHQTDGTTAEGAISGYKNKELNKDRLGAHFLIDKDGTIYQTASIDKITRHVGKLKSRCFEEHACKPDELSKLKKAMARPNGKVKARHDIEKKKSVPSRYPMNEDSIGIELVGRAYPSKDTKIKEPVFETVTDAQNASLKWLIQELVITKKLSQKEIYRHPIVSQKNPTEAATAKW